LNDKIKEKTGRITAVDGFLSYQDFLKLIFQDRVLAFSSLVMLGTIVYVYKMVKDRTAFVVSLLIVIFAGVMFTRSVVDRGYAYEDGVLSVNTEGKMIRIPANQIQDIQLVERNAVYPSLRVSGLGLSSVETGLFTLNTGKEAGVFLYFPSDRALLVTDGNSHIYYLADPRSVFVYEAVQKDRAAGSSM
jgi:hypothetical protein